MVGVVRSSTFDRWLSKLRDRRAAARVLIRINRLAAGNPGDVKPVGGGISELRIDYGPGYRVYYLREGDRLTCCSAAATRRPRVLTSRPRTTSPNSGERTKEETDERQE